VQYLRVKSGRLALTAFVVLFFGTAAVHASRLIADEYPHRLFAAHRRSTIHWLENQGGRHLVIVRYAPATTFWTTGFSTTADIDGSPIVWARDMGEARNRELLHYYKDRRPWLLQPDAADDRLKPVPPYASSEKSGLDVPGGGLAGSGGAPGDSAGPADSAANGPRRVRLPAGR
jgi:hypothetical protein